MPALKQTGRVSHRARGLFSLTLLLAVLLVLFSSLPAAAQSSIHDFPSLSGPTALYNTPYFRIHYTLQGQDAVSPLDSSNSGRPDYVEALADTLEHVRHMMVDVYGWAAPPTDPPGTLYNIFLMDLYSYGLIGFVSGGHADAIIGSNPNTPAQETSASLSFMVLDRDYGQLSQLDEMLLFGEPLTEQELMQVIIAHEFTHAVQFGYDAYERASWLWEATATWMQEEIYPDIKEGHRFLPSVFDSPDTCQFSYGDEERSDVPRWYGQWIFLRYISERYGHEAVRSIWEHARHLDSYEAIDAALADLGTNFTDLLRGYSAALLLRDFRDGALYPLVRVEAAVGTDEFYIADDGVGQVASDYIELHGSGPVTVRFSSGMLGVLVGIQDGTAHVYYARSDHKIELDLTPFSHVYLIVNNPERVPTEMDCRYRPYTLNIHPAFEEAHPPTAIIPALNFTAPPSP